MATVTIPGIGMIAANRIGFETFVPSQLWERTQNEKGPQVANDKEICVNINPWFLRCLCLILLTLKLCNIIDWSWWTVFAPIYAMPAIIVSMCLAILAFALTVSIMGSVCGRASYTFFWLKKNYTLRRQ
jgi:hypothetical protein